MGPNLPELAAQAQAKIHGRIVFLALLYSLYNNIAGLPKTLQNRPLRSPKSPKSAAQAQAKIHGRIVLLALL